MQTTTFMKVLSGLLIMVFFGTLHAQDIIITKDAQKIEAKILEVSNSEIKYKKQSNLEGPTFILGVEELNSIIYANGEVQVFPTKEPEANEPQSEVIWETGASYNENIGGGVIARDVANNYYLDGKRISEGEYVYYLKTHCPSVYQYHIDAMEKERLGKVFCGLAIGCFVAAIPLVMIGYSSLDEVCWYAGWGCAFASDCFTAACIPLWIVGAKRRHSSHELYNQQCSGKLSLNLQSGKNGFGLALRF